MERFPRWPYAAAEQVLHSAVLQNTSVAVLLADFYRQD